MKKPSFLSRNEVTVVPMIEKATPPEIISSIRNCIFDGADAIGIMLDYMERDTRSSANFKEIFRYAGNKPIYITNYRQRKNTGMTDRELMDELFLALDAGAELIDVMGDTFDLDGSCNQMATSADARKKQRELIDEIHSRGGEVLMSSHIFRFLEEETVLDIARRQQDQNVDIVKIVTYSGSEDEMLANFKTSLRLKKELDRPFLFLVNGPYCKLQRIIGPALGSCMVLCVQDYEPQTFKDQPQLRATKIALSNIDWDIYRQ